MFWAKEAGGWKQGWVVEDASSQIVFSGLEIQLSSTVPAWRVQGSEFDSWYQKAICCTQCNKNNLCSLTSENPELPHNGEALRRGDKFPVMVGMQLQGRWRGE